MPINSKNVHAEPLPPWLCTCKLYCIDLLPDMGEGDLRGEGLGEGLGEGWGEGLGEGLGEGWGEGLGEGLGEGWGEGWGEGLGEHVAAAQVWLTGIVSVVLWKLSPLEAAPITVTRSEPVSKFFMFVKASYANGFTL